MLLVMASSSDVDTGVPTGIIAELLPCLGDSDDVVLHHHCPDLVARLEARHDQLGERIACLVRNRDPIGDHVARVRAGTGTPAAQS